MGTCNGVLSSCALGGYAMETRYALFPSSLAPPSRLLTPRRRCHLGKSIIYDTVSNLSWAVDIRTHTIGTVITQLLEKPWDHAVQMGREVPLANAEDECVVSFTRFVLGVLRLIWGLGVL